VNQVVKVMVWLIMAFFVMIVIQGPIQAQSFKIKGTVIDEYGEPIQFAHLNMNGDTLTSFFSDISGRFSVRWHKLSDTISIDHIDFIKRRIQIKQLIKDTLKIKLNYALPNNEVTVKDAFGIVEKIVANDRLHDPEKQGGTFRYSTYSKSTVDLVKIGDHRVSDRYENVIQNDSLFHIHHRISGNQHVEVVESMTERYFTYPKKYHEKILGLRETGLHDQQLMALHSNRHAISFYGNYFEFLGTRYVSPIGVETYDKYTFEEKERYYSGLDTIFVLAFKPLKLRTTGLEGLMYVNSNQYAVQSIFVKPVHNVMVDFKISQKSEFIDSAEWFPTQLNHVYFVEKYPKKYLGTIYEKKTYMTHIELNPEVEPDEFGLELVLMDHYATEQDEEFWDTHRIEPLSKREKRTYLRVDTLRHTNTVHNVMDRGSAFFNGNLHYKIGHLTLNNLFSLNRYEGVRLGLGASAGKELLKVFEFSGYGAYGLRDNEWKWGVGGGFFLNEKKEMELKFMHRSDLAEPGHIDYLNKEDDFFRAIFTDRMDKVQTNKLSYTFRSPKYHLFEFGLKMIEDQPTYAYEFLKEDETGALAPVSLFKATEFGFSTRYALNEKVISMFENVSRLNSFSPIIYFNYRRGYDGFLNGEYKYHKFTGMLEYQFYIGHLGKASLDIDAGIISGNLPYPFLFNGKGGNLSTSSVIIEDHFQTMGLYEFVSDKYLNIFFSHNFGSKLFAHARFRPDIVVYQHFGWGNLKNEDRHVSDEPFPSTYGDGFVESGLGFNNIIKYNLFGKMYGGLGIGFFYRYGAHANPGGFTENFVYRVTYVLRSL
jgi:hypothetical protein